MVTLNNLMMAPYVDHGRDLSGLDCWGFVRLVRHYHHNLPMLASFGSVSPDDKSGMTKGYDQVVAGFCQTKPINGAIACHFVGEILVHVGGCGKRKWPESRPYGPKNGETTFGQAFRVRANGVDYEVLHRT